MATDDDMIANFRSLIEAGINDGAGDESDLVDFDAWVGEMRRVKLEDSTTKCKHCGELIHQRKHTLVWVHGRDRVDCNPYSMGWIAEPAAS